MINLRAARSIAGSIITELNYLSAIAIAENDVAFTRGEQATGRW